MYMYVNSLSANVTGTGTTNYHFQFADAPNQQALKGDNVNNMAQQGYCQPREFQGPPQPQPGGPSPLGPVYQPWETAGYEPAGDVSCL